MPFLTAALGWAAGILINRAADGLPRGRFLAPARCPACTAPCGLLSWSALASLLSQRTRCDYCGRELSARSVFVEAISIVGGVALWFWRPDLARWLAALVVGFWFLLVAVVDLEHRLIPHRVTMPAALMIGLIGVLDPARGPLKTVLGGAVGLALFFVLYLLGGAFGRLAARLQGRPLEEIPFGFGDVTLAGVIGLAVGFPGVIVALFFGILAAGAFSLAYLLVMLFRRRYSAFTAIPYGPFMILGACLVYFGGRTVLEGLLGG